jgi:hypothetical protein
LNAVDKYVRVYASYDFLSDPAMGKEKNGFLRPLGKKRRQPIGKMGACLA